jgi:hypothetical protein
MSNVAPTNSELKIMLDNFSKNTEEKHNLLIGLLHEIKSDVKETKEQAYKTNGRVNKLEASLEDYPQIKRDTTSNTFWIKAVVTGLGIAGAVVLALPSFFPNFDPLNVKEKARQAVREELSMYNIEMK